MKRKHFDLYKIFIYIALISLAISIIIPVSWVFLASIKTNAEFYGNPWALPQGFNIFRTLLMPSKLHKLVILS